jgi:3-hydroxymyristoyl/3-hydroxydecanoyl-(acyl carrier protein) dehydratase
MDKGGPDLLVDHIEHYDQGCDIIIFIRGFQAVEEIATGHFQKHPLDALYPKIVIVRHGCQV